jgi:hypothetical protein
VAGLFSLTFLQLSSSSELTFEKRLKIIVMLLGATFFSGVVPLALTNYLNTGSVFLTTYSTADASGFLFDFSVLKRNIDFYLFKSPASISVFLTLIIASVFLFLMFNQNIDRNAKRISRNIFLAILVVMGLSFMYFGFHSIQNPYYMWPSSFFIVLLGIFNLIVPPSSLEPIRRSSMLLQMAILGIVLGSVALHNFAGLSRSSYHSVMPDEVLRPEAIVWADLTSGTILTYNSKYAAKLNFGSVCAQEKIVRRVLETGRPQYLVIDSGDMLKVVNRLSTHAQLTLVGYFQTYKEIEVYRLDLIGEEGLVNCSA